MIDSPDIYHISSLHLISHFDCPCSGAAQPGTELGSQRWWWQNFGPYGGGNGQWGKETYVKSPKYIDDWRFLVYSNFKPKSKGRTFSTGTYFLDWGRISIRNVILTCLCSPSRVLVFIYTPYIHLHGLEQSNFPKRDILIRIFFKKGNLQDF